MEEYDDEQLSFVEDELPEEHVTHFEEDDDPEDLVGKEVKEKAA